MLDYIEREIVGTGKRPDGEHHERGESQRRIIQQDDGAGEQAGEKEQHSLEIDDARRGKIAHIQCYVLSIAAQKQPQGRPSLVRPCGIVRLHSGRPLTISCRC